MVWARTAISVAEGKCAEVAVVGAMTVWTNCSYHLLIPSGAACAWFQMHCCYFIVGCSGVCWPYYLVGLPGLSWFLAIPSAWSLDVPQRGILSLTGPSSQELFINRYKRYKILCHRWRNLVSEPHSVCSFHWGLPQTLYDLFSHCCYHQHKENVELCFSRSRELSFSRPHSKTAAFHIPRSMGHSSI